MGSSPSRPTLSVAGATGQRRRLLSARLPVRVWGDARLARVIGHPTSFSARRLRVRAPRELPCRCYSDGKGWPGLHPGYDAGSIPVSGSAEGARYQPGPINLDTRVRISPPLLIPYSSMAEQQTVNLSILVRVQVGEPGRISTTGQCTTPSRWRVPVRIRYASPWSLSSAGTSASMTDWRTMVRNHQRPLGSYGETEITSVYGTGIGGSSPSGSTQGGSA
jgi:hypothetical protein